MKNNYQEMFSNIGNAVKEITKKFQEDVAKLKRPALEASVDLFAEIGWNKWSKAQLENDGQFSCFEKAFTDKMEIVSIDYKNKSGQVRSSKVYDITGNGCTCKDCAIRRLPCKHMYFLAYQLSKGEINSEDLQLTLDAKPESIEKQDDDLTLKFEQLGCCSLFRDCSRAGHCLQKDDYYQQCGYRKNLESGKIFYTEKSDSFNKERYDYIENFRGSLDESEKIIFDEILTYFEMEKRGSQNCFCISTPKIKNLLEKCKAFELLSSKELVSRIFGAGLISNTRAAEFHSQYSKLPQPELTKNKAQNQKIWKEHYLSDPDLQQALAERFLYIQNGEYRFELNEYFVVNHNNIVRDLNELIYFDAEDPKTFRDKIV